MSVGFGFSVTDVAKAIEIVATIIDALRESGNVSGRYRELVAQLYSLETALLQVKRLEFDGTQSAEYHGLQQAAAQCQLTIENFWKKNPKYNGLFETRHSSKLKAGWLKIMWALCKEDDINKFRADISGHTEAIQVLLAAIQLHRTTLSDHDRNDQHRSIMSKVQECYFKSMKQLCTVAIVFQDVLQGKQLLEIICEVARKNVQIFQIVLEIQNFVTRIPGQVERQQPVYLIDALGKISPFHLEFIRSAEALVAVLKVNFRKIGRAAEKIEQGEFAINDADTKRDVNLETDWDVCFFPGQHVEMSMVFEQQKKSGDQCPKCQEICSSSNNLDVECIRCGMIFRRITDLDDLDTAQTEESPNLCEPGGLSLSHGTSSRKRKRQGGSNDEDSELALFRRVRILPSYPPISENPLGTLSKTSGATNQRARKSTGGKAPSKQYASKAARKNPSTARTTRAASRRSARTA